MDDAGTLGSAEQWLQCARQTFAATAEAMGEPLLFDTLQALLRRGNSAAEQLRWEAQAQASGADALASLHQVVDLLLAQTRGDH